MSRREIVVNTLMGVLLVSSALVTCLGIATIFWLAIWAIKYAFDYFFPGLVFPVDLVVFSMCAYAFGDSFIRNVRRGKTREAFLSFVAIAALVSCWFAPANSIFAGDRIPVLMLLPLLMILPGPIRRIEFFIGAAVLSAVLAVNDGLVGSGRLAHAALGGTLILTSVWIGIRTRRGFDASEPQQTARPVVA